MRLKSLLIAGAAAFAIVIGPALAQDGTTKYQQWQGYNSENMQDLINQLDEQHGYGPRCCWYSVIVRRIASSSSSLGLV